MAAGIVYAAAVADVVVADHEKLSLHEMNRNHPQAMLVYHYTARHVDVVAIQADMLHMGAVHLYVHDYCWDVYPPHHRHLEPPHKPHYNRTDLEVVVHDDNAPDDVAVAVVDSPYHQAVVGEGVRRSHSMMMLLCYIFQPIE